MQKAERAVSDADDSLERRKYRREDQSRAPSNHRPRQPVVVAQYACVAEHWDELAFKAGDKIVVTKMEDPGWWEGSLNGKIGLFPSNYVRLATPSESEDVGGWVEPNGAQQKHRRRTEGTACDGQCNSGQCVMQ
jgi:hypothetical protein